MRVSVAVCEKLTTLQTRIENPRCFVWGSRNRRHIGRRNSREKQNKLKFSCNDDFDLFPSSLLSHHLVKIRSSPLVIFSESIFSFR